MSRASLSTSVNQHYLNKLMKLTEVMDVAASEDIVDVRGMKLVAKGTKLTRAQQDTLGGHKLKKTLESSLSAEGGADNHLILETAKRILDTSVPINRILGPNAGRGISPQTLLANMHFGHAMRMMITLTDRENPRALEHSVTVSLLSIGMAKKLQLSNDDQMAAALAGLLHDVGELYIDPAYLKPGKRLLPHEWAHLVIHPRIGQVLITELESYPVSVARAVSEHHERLDGTGYPRQSAGGMISGPGLAVSVAEMLAGVLHKDYPLERAELALKIIPGEHPHHFLSAISGALRNQPANRPIAPSRPDENDDEAIARLLSRIADSLQAGQQMLGEETLRSPRVWALIERALARIRNIERAFISTGLDAYLKNNHGLHDHDDGTLQFEKAVATREITWRLRDIARDLALNTADVATDRDMLAGLIGLLDGGLPDAAIPLSQPLSQQLPQQQAQARAA
ncbi:HD-GYP domain-containing protein [Massilia pseudoviolaceinigra]|uniref:HD-GYP domain-containing protein n=1 Tax=Massilia pseudoviolaceinigra TaxID=3057165 RepID=UPI002796760C|nr:HD domain-containing phosphohydrolase [Massilia sp. CCM 9206]MDQ1920815.1 HD domain-containing protein [Massilia sp. CCM 9206]